MNNSTVKKYGLLLSVLLFSSCGIEDYMFLFQVPQGNIRLDSNTVATVKLPDSNEYYFRYYGIYYKIFISPSNETSEIPGDSLSIISAQAASDYNYFLPYMDESPNNTTNTSSVGSILNNRRYNLLALEGARIENVLSSSADGKTITFDFIDTGGSNRPYLQIDNNEYILMRNSSIPGAGEFTPMPENDFSFRNSPEIVDQAYQAQNIDVYFPTAGILGTKYAYAVFYIVAIGQDDNISPIYSRPTYLGALRLPDFR